MNTEANGTSERTDRGYTFLRKHGVRKRMQCTAQSAARIDDAFVTVEELVEAVESDKPLTEYGGIGPKTAGAIEKWWENRTDREEKIGSATVERTGAETATVHFHNSWADALGMGDES